MNDAHEVAVDVAACASDSDRRDDSNSESRRYVRLIFVRNEFLSLEHDSTFEAALLGSS